VQVAVLLPFGLGGGLAVPALNAALLESVDADRAGLAAGLLNAGRQFGGALGVALFGSLAGGAVVTGLHMGALVGAAVLVVTTTATVVFVRPRSSRGPAAPVGPLRLDPGPARDEGSVAPTSAGPDTR
jgi:DHA2 family methylenomycin A resistance protein-like MFS transporter